MKLLVMNGDTVANVIEVDPDNIPEPFADFPEAPEGVGVGMVWDGHGYNPPEPEPLNNEDVNHERDRRILEGKTFTTSAGPVAVAGDETTTRNLQALAVSAQMRIANGEASTITQYRDETDTIHDLTQAQVIELWSYSVAFLEANFKASWAIKDDPDGIPEDFTDDSYWP